MNWLKIKNKIKNVLDKYKNEIKNVFFFLLLCFVYLLFEKQLVQLFDAYVLPLFSIMEFNWRTKIFFFILLLYPAYLIYQCFKNRYFIPCPTSSLLLFVTLLYIRYRWFGAYTTFPTLIWIDVLAFMLAAFLMSCLMAYIPFRKKVKAADRKEGDFSYLQDSPITTEKEDCLGFSNRVKALAKQLERVPAENSCSIGIIGSWGMGKTSFLNLLEKNLNENKDDFIIVKINPRHSFTAKNIQEDFFEELFSTLKKYDSRFSTNFKNYLKAIDILNDNKILSFLFNIQKLWDKESEKSKINYAIERLNKRIVVIIEDFDRLLDDEIIEVFKLIDGNASFKNLIFITAYDKNHINKIIEKAYTDEHSFFSDKFFTIEIFLPLNPYDNVYNYLSAELFKNDCFNEASKPGLREILKKHTDLLEKYLPTFRDVNRFLNLFVFPYSEVPEEVEFEDFFLLYLIKYKYPKEYIRLYNKEFIYMDNKTKFNKLSFGHIVQNMYTLKNDLDSIKDIKSKDVINLLFSKTEISNRSINNIDAFDIYFYEDIHNRLSRKEVKKHLFNDNFEDTRNYIYQYILDPNLDAIIGVVCDKDVYPIKSKEEFERYLDILFYISSKNTLVSQMPIFNEIHELIKTNNLEYIKETYRYVGEEYETLLYKKIIRSYPNYPYKFTSWMIGNIIDRPNLKDDIIFKQWDFLKIPLDALNDCIKNEPQISQKHLNLLSCYIDNRQNGDVKLSQEACRLVKKLIEKNPSSYFDLFLPESESPYAKGFIVNGEIFYKQIFGSNEEFESFIEKQTKDSVPNIDLIKNFWRLFKYNNYEYLKLTGNWQDKKNNNFEEEIKQLDQLFDIERRLNENENSNEQTLSKEALFNELEKIPLDILLRRDIIRRINNLKP